jgi:hypothetical protein
MFPLDIMSHLEIILTDLLWLNLIVGFVGNVIVNSVINTMVTIPDEDSDDEWETPHRE